METKDLFACEIGKLNENQRQLLKDTLRFGEWGDGRGDMLFIRSDYYDQAMSWANEPNK